MFLYVKAWRQAARAGAGPPGPRRPRLLALLRLCGTWFPSSGLLMGKRQLMGKRRQVKLRHTRVPGWGGRRGKGQAREVTSELG